MIKKAKELGYLKELKYILFGIGISVFIFRIVLELLTSSGVSSQFIFSIDTFALLIGFYVGISLLFIVFLMSGFSNNYQIGLISFKSTNLFINALSYSFSIVLAIILFKFLNLIYDGSSLYSVLSEYNLLSYISIAIAGYVAGLFFLKGREKRIYYVTNTSIL